METAGKQVDDEEMKIVHFNEFSFITGPGNHMFGDIKIEVKPVSIDLHAFADASEDNLENSSGDETKENSNFTRSSSWEHLLPVLLT